MNVVGEAVDGMRPLSKEGAFPIHREPLSLMNCLLCRKCSSQVSRLLICWKPYSKGGKSDCWGAGVGKTVLIMELINKHCQET